MKNSITKLSMSLMIICLTTSAAFAGGYQLNLLGQRQVGMGHTGTGFALDLATISMNPGGLASVNHNGILVGGNATFINTTYSTNPEMFPMVAGDYEAETDSDVRTPFSIYAAFDTPVENLRAGLGVYTPYGNSIRWGDDWLYSGLLTEISMSTIFIQPTLSYQLSDRLGIGAGLIYTIGSVNLQRRVHFDQPPGAMMDVELDGSTTAFGFNAGVLYQHNDMLSLGVSYRSEIDMEMESGDATFNLNEQAAPYAGAFPSENKFDATLPLPAVLSIGLGLNVNEDFRIGIDGNLTFWSTYERLAFTFEQDPAGELDSDEPRNYNDRWIFRIGGEWDASNELQLRLGTYYDPSPVDEGYLTPETPDVDRFGFTAGIGYAFTPQAGINASLLFITSSERSQTMEDASQDDTPDVVPIGKFQTNALIPGISLYYRF